MYGVMYLLCIYVRMYGLGKKAWFSGNTCLIKTISYGILILIEGGKAQYIRNEIFLSSNL